MQPPDIQETPTPYHVKPLWSPLLISWISLLFTPIPAVVLAAINFGRLGYTQKQKIWLFYAILVALVMCVLTFRLVFIPESSLRSLGPLSLIFSVAIAWRLYLSQHKLFERHLQQGGKKSSVWVPLLVSFVWVAIVFGVSFSGEMILEAKLTRDFDKALALMDKGELKQAETIFRTIKRSYPEETATMFNLAIIYAETGREALAKQELKRILKIEPDNTGARDLLDGLQTP